MAETAASLATLNAIFNSLAAVSLLLGLLFIRQKKITAHRACMVTAFILSILFLISYLTRFYLTGTHRYPGTGWDRTVYLIILGSHTPLAALVPFLALRTLYLAVKDRIASHRRWARVTFPIWLYVNVTGVVIYLMLY